MRVSVVQRVVAAASRVQALNPRVNVETKTDAGLLKDEAFLGSFDLIVLTDVDAATLVSRPLALVTFPTRALTLGRWSQNSTNALTRSLGKKLYAASSVGIDGWIFADLLTHEYIV